METALAALDWKQFLENASAEARTEPGKAIIQGYNQKENWASDVAAARFWQQETQEISPLLDRDALWGPLTGLQDPASRLEQLSKGSVLEVPDLASIRAWLYAIDTWVQTPHEEIRGEHFKKALNQLANPFEPLRILERILTPTGELSERASPRLASIHAEIRALKGKIHQTLDHLLKTFSQKGVLQENFTDVRDGRYVLPVKISNQTEVEGIVYEASVSRQTVFVEPKEIAPFNNLLRQRQNDLIQEIHAILLATAQALRPFAAEIQSSCVVITHWDAVQARARLGLHYSGKPIHVSEERIYLIHQTAHPLLWWSLPKESIVRNEIDFGEPVRALLLTGPNTGGKTVLLKTLGLAGVCARTGFPFPAIEHPVVPFFDAFFADLGDHQSIEQHLSSFSGHILRFKEILENVSERSLVLIDELNTATDPEEGGALGRAFLETLIEKGALIVATTHDPRLKAIALGDKRILNASMAFDESARTPTYHMLLGVPGRSRALETSARLGIPESVLALARKYLSREHAEFEQIIAKLESDSQESTRARKEAVALREEALRLKEEWLGRTRASIGDVIERTRQKLRRALEQAQDEIRASVRTQNRFRLNETFQQTTSHIENALKEEAPEIAEVLAETEPPQVAEETKKPALEPGVNVRIPKWKTTGQLLEFAGNKAKVLVGTMQMTLSIEDIEPVIGQPGPAQSRLLKPTQTVMNDAAFTPSSELDLRGARYEDAMSELEHFLDIAFRSGSLAEVTIIHGLGTGALREGTRKLLKQLPYIKSFRDGGTGRGGTGSTVVEFEK